MSTVELRTTNGKISGRCDSAFNEVLETFRENFELRREVGAAVCVLIGGKTVVDLWGGARNVAGEPWQSDTLCIVHSCTKGASALCAHMAADRGLLDWEAPVVRYWPEFGQGRKETALARMMLDHSVGVPGLRDELPAGSPYDYEYMCDRVAAEEAFWEPGTRHGYHGLTAAWTVGELVRRTTGRRLGRFLAEEVAGPLGIDFWIGLPAKHEDRVSNVIPHPVDDQVRNSRLAHAVRADRMSPAGRFVLNDGGIDVNSRECRAAEVGSVNGVTNARGLAGLYAPLANGGAWKGVRIVSEDAITRMGRVSVASHLDATLCIPTRFALGYMKSMDNRRLENGGNCSVILAEPAFGHVGAGGALGFADPGPGLSFGYVMNRMGFGILMNERGQSLVDATYRALGYRTDAGGAWSAS